MRKLIVLIVFTSSTALAAVHPTRAQAAYLDEHDKCVSSLRTAKKDVKAAPVDRRKVLLDAAKQAYRQCEEHAHLVWKFFPNPPPSSSQQ